MPIGSPPTAVSGTLTTGAPRTELGTLNTEFPVGRATGLPGWSCSSFGAGPGGWSNQRIHDRRQGCMFGTDVLALQNESAIAVRTETLRRGDHALGAEADAIGVLGHQVADI